MLPAIYYHPEAFSTENSISDMSASGESFIKAIPEQEQYFIYAPIKEPAEHFSNILKNNNKGGEVIHIDDKNIGLLSKIGCLYAPTPAIGLHASKRAMFGADSYSICCIANMNPFFKTLDMVVDYISKPVYPWDALVCPSESVKKIVSSVLQAEINRMQSRLGAKQAILPQLPVIPYAVDVDGYQTDDKVEAKGNVGLDEDDVVILSSGKFALHDKAHPIALYQAAEIASKKSDKKVSIILCGKFQNDKVKQAFRDLAYKECPSVKVLIMDDFSEENRKVARSCADIYCELPDSFEGAGNFFAIEAMASAVPVVVADWGALAEAVDDEVGFKIPIRMPKAGQGLDLIQKLGLGIDSYDMFCGLTSSLISVDVEMAAEALAKLIESEKMRKKMGDAGRDRAKNKYDWAVIMPMYEKLWSELGKIREENRGKVKEYVASKLEPFAMFKEFGGSSVEEEAELVLTCQPDKAYEKLKEYRTVDATRFAGNVLPTDDEMFAMVCDMRGESFKPIDAVANIEDSRKPFALRSIYWMIKVGIVAYKK